MVLFLYIDKFAIVLGRHASDFVHLSMECSLALLRHLNFVLLILGTQVIVSSLALSKRSVDELHCDHFIRSCRVRIRDALLKLSALEGILLVVELFLFLDKFLHIHFVGFDVIQLFLRLASSVV